MIVVVELDVLTQATGDDPSLGVSISVSGRQLPQESTKCIEVPLVRIG